jgi:hypothetical protein
MEFCPTTGDHTFNVHNVRLAVGIPMHCLRVIDNPEPYANDANLVVLPDGRFALVVAQECVARGYAPMRSSRVAATGRGNFLVAAEDRQRDNQRPVPPHLTCPLCHNLMTDAVSIPCCGGVSCDECTAISLYRAWIHLMRACRRTHISFAARWAPLPALSHQRAEPRLAQACRRCASRDCRFQVWRPYRDRAFVGTAVSVW